MSDTAWISPALRRSENILPLVNSFTENDQREIGIEWGNQNVAGYSLKADCFPDTIWGNRSAREANYNRLADLFYAATVWVVSSAAANVLRQFDLGAGGLYPVKVLKKDRATLVDGEWSCINFGNKKDALLLSESAPMNETYVYKGKKAWKPKSTFKDGDIAISRAALSGPDIWIDPLVAGSFFVSDDLGKALKKAKAAKGFFYISAALFDCCRIIQIFKVMTSLTNSQ